ncbi:hypothetical protein KAR91_82445 [Candidatus Pacearchaeota archaeon]|nr:hypothetical protein [Candidatus Pacearchaeota archaeon]
MGILSFLKAPKTLDKVTDAIISGGDKLMLTDEERLDYNIKAAEIHLKLTEKIGNESTPTSISRRVVGLTVLIPFGFLSIGGAILHAFGMEESGAHWLLVSDNFQMPSLAVIGFYFGSHIAGKLKS